MLKLPTKGEGRRVYLPLKKGEGNWEELFFAKTSGTGSRGRGKNRPFPSSKKSHFQSEAKCEAIDMKMIFNYDANKTHFHNKGFALSLVLKVRFFGTRTWPIVNR